MAKILIVEDENIVAWDIKETLEKLGHRVVDRVVSGAEAIQAAAKDEPDLVLMDIRLAGEMDGITAGDEIYHQLEIPVVYLTAHADDRTLDRATQTNPFGYIIKPFQPQALQSTIQVALHRHQLEESVNTTQAWLANTLNSIGGGIIVTDRQGLVTFMNPIAESLTGWHSTEALGKEIGQVFRLIWETDGDAIENPSLCAMRLKQPVKSLDRCWLVAKDGAEIPIYDTATPIVKPNGEVVGSVVVFQDNTERQLALLELGERNQDLETFQLKLISLLQDRTAEYQQAIACIQVLDRILKRVRIAQSEYEILDIAIQQLGTTLDADYGWVALHDPHHATARLVCEYISSERQIHTISAIGQEIDLQLYPKFYRHLCQLESWIDPPQEIIPSLYLDLLAPASEMLICPIVVEPENYDPGPDRAIGEAGILTTGKSTWTSSQASLITQILSYAVKLFRQTHSQSTDRESIALCLEWLNSLKDDLISSIAHVERDMKTSAQMLQQQIRAIDVETKDAEVVQHHQFLLHRQLLPYLQILQGEWQREFDLIDTLIDVQTGGALPQNQALNDVEFQTWIERLVTSCSDLAERHQQQLSYEITDHLPPILLGRFAILEQIVMELFSNACNYTPPHQHIVLSVDPQPNQLKLSVISMAIEIPPADLATIFLPFDRDSHHPFWKHSVNGLGLSLVKKLVPYLGGEIRADSDRGSTSLILTVPI